MRKEQFINNFQKSCFTITINIARIVVIVTILIVISTSNNLFAVFPNIFVIYIAFS